MLAGNFVKLQLLRPTPNVCSQKAEGAPGRPPRILRDSGCQKGADYWLPSRAAGLIKSSSAVGAGVGITCVLSSC